MLTPTLENKVPAKRARLNLYFMVSEDLPMYVQEAEMTRSAARMLRAEADEIERDPSRFLSKLKDVDGAEEPE